MFFDLQKFTTFEQIKRFLPNRKIIMRKELILAGLCLILTLHVFVCESTETHLQCEPKHPWFKAILKRFRCRRKKCGDKCMVSCLPQLPKYKGIVGSLDSCVYKTIYKIVYKELFVANQKILISSIQPKRIKRCTIVPSFL